MQTAMMMTMMHDDDDDGDHVVEQDGLAMVQTQTWPLDYHHCVLGLRSFISLVTEGKHPLPPLVSNAYLRKIRLYRFNRWARPCGCCYDGENDDVDDDVMAMTRVTTMAMTWVTTMAH